MKEDLLSGRFLEALARHVKWLQVEEGIKPLMDSEAYKKTKYSQAYKVLHVYIQSYGYHQVPFGYTDISKFIEALLDSVEPRELGYSLYP